MKYTKICHVSLLAAVTLLTVSVTSIAAESDAVGKPVGKMAYPMWQNGCVLANDAAQGAKVAAQIGEVLKTKHGNWKCALVVADQQTGKLAAAWVPTEK